MQARSIGRGPKGKPRNFRAMSDEKLLAVFDAIAVEPTLDREVVNEIGREIKRRFERNSAAVTAGAIA